jgi:hypothetical protein
MLLACRRACKGCHARRYYIIHSEQALSLAGYRIQNANDANDHGQPNAANFFFTLQLSIPTAIKIKSMSFAIEHQNAP